MGLKKIVATAVLALGLLTPSVSNSQDTAIRYTGERYKIKYNNNNYVAKRCFSALDRVNGWCILDREGNYITNPDLYSNIALIAEVTKDSNLLSSTVDSSKKTFDKALKVQLGVDISKFALENLSEIEGPLIVSVVTGGSSLSKAAQIQTARTAFKQQQEKVFLNIKEEFNREYLDNIKQLSQDLISGKITENQLKEKENELEQKLRNAFGNSYEYQLKLASTELAKAQKLRQKPNKTYADYELLWSYTRDGLSRGFMAAKAINMINESNTLENNFKLAASKMIEGAGLESVLEISVDNPDFEKISEEAEHEFYKFYNSLDKQKSYWEANNKNSNASKMIPIVNYLQDRKEIIDNAKKQREEKSKVQPQRTEPVAKKNPVVYQEPKKIVQEEGEGGRYTAADQAEKFDDQQGNDKENIEKLIRLSSCLDTNYTYPYNVDSYKYWNLLSSKEQERWTYVFGNEAQKISENTCDGSKSNLKIDSIEILNHPYGRVYVSDKIDGKTVNGKYTVVLENGVWKLDGVKLDNAHILWVNNEHKKEFFKSTLGQLWAEQISNFNEDGNSRYESYDGKLNDFYKSNEIKGLRPIQYYDCDLSIKLTGGDPSDINSPWTITVSCNIDRDNELESWAIDSNTKRVTQLQDDNVFEVK